MKEQDGEERAIAYFSRGLTSAEKNYCTYKRELLAVVNACDYFRVYLLWKPFTLRTDHQALKWFFSQEPPDGNILSRWMAKLQEFPITLDYAKGRANVGADALSRIPWAASTPENYCEKSFVARKRNAKEKLSIEWGPVEFAWEKDQDADPDLALIKSG